MKRGRVRLLVLLLLLRRMSSHPGLQRCRRRRYQPSDGRQSVWLRCLLELLWWPRRRRLKACAHQQVPGFKRLKRVNLRKHLQGRFLRRRRSLATVDGMIHPFCRFRAAHSSLPSTTYAQCRPWFRARPRKLNPRFGFKSPRPPLFHRPCAFRSRSRSSSARSFVLHSRSRLDRSSKSRRSSKLVSTGSKPSKASHRRERIHRRRHRRTFHGRRHRRRAHSLRPSCRRLLRTLRRLRGDRCGLGW